MRTTGTTQSGRFTVFKGERVRVRANVTSATTQYLCANCDVRFQSGSRLTAFCSLACKSQAGVVRAFQSAFSTYGRNSLPEDVEQALRIQMAHALSGGYDSVARYLPRAAREAIIERDGGLCVFCQSPGTEIDHIDVDSSDPTNLRLLCHSCHAGVTMSHHRHIDPRTEPEVDALFRTLTERIDRTERVDHATARTGPPHGASGCSSTPSSNRLNGNIEPRSARSPRHIYGPLDGNRTCSDGHRPPVPWVESCRVVYDLNAVRCGGVS